MDLTSYFEKACSYNQCVEKIEGENLDLHQRHYDKFTMPESTLEQLKNIAPLNILVITEPWCGDSLAILPVMRKIAKIKGWEIKVLFRDENLDLMDQFLTHGGRAVPVFLFLDQQSRLLFRFGPRPKAAQDIFEVHRADINAGKIEKMEVIKKIRNFYSKDRGKAILKEFLSLLKENHLIQ